MSMQLTDLYTSNFANLLVRADALFARRQALIIDSQIITFGDLASRSANVADVLTTKEIRPGDVCAIFMRRPDDAAVAFFGALSVGAVAVIVSEFARPRQLEQALSDSSARILLTSYSDLAAVARPLQTTSEILCFEDVPSNAAVLRPVPRAGAECAQITFTSGSTGLPKGVMMSHANLWAGVRIVAGYLGIEPEDRLAGILPLSFVYGFNQLTTALFTGCALVIDRSPMAQDVATALRRAEITVLAAVPPLWQQLLSAPAFHSKEFRTLRIMTNAGGRLSPSNVKELRRTQPHSALYLMYGLTEVFRSTILPTSEVDAHPDSIGRAVPESRVYVVNENNELAADDEVGELVHGGPTVAIGYLNAIEETRRTFRLNPFIDVDPMAPPRVAYSGDLVRRDHEGLLYYVGRRDRLFKTMGFRASPDEVVDVLVASDEVVEAAVVPSPDPQRGSIIVAFVVMKPAGDLKRLKGFCARELPRHLLPSQYEVLHRIPRTSNGKHDLAALENLVNATR